LENKLEFQERIRAHYWSLEKDGLTLGNDEKASTDASDALTCVPLLPGIITGSLTTRPCV
jgi:hypothetical protein